MKSLFVDSDVETVQDVLDDLTECERDDRKIVAVQSENGNTDKEARWGINILMYKKKDYGNGRLERFEESAIELLTITAVNAPTDIKPACPSESSPEMPTTRFSDTAMII